MPAPRPRLRWGRPIAAALILAGATTAARGQGTAPVPQIVEVPSPPVTVPVPGQVPAAPPTPPPATGFPVAPAPPLPGLSGTPTPPPTPVAPPSLTAPPLPAPAIAAPLVTPPLSPPPALPLSPSPPPLPAAAPQSETAAPEGGLPQGGSEAGVGVVVPPPPTPPPGIPTAPAEVAPLPTPAPEAPTPSQTVLPAAEPPAQPPTGPSAAALVEAEILPVLARATQSALRLQNAVIRYCFFDTEVARRELSAAFLDTVVDGAATTPLAFGSPSSTAIPGRILTQAASTAFSRTRLEAMMAGRADVPRTLSALRQEEEALMGLSALEQILLGNSYSDDQPLQMRCRLALPIAANIHETLHAAQLNWENRSVAPHWTGDDVDLADRLRLRDLIQATIDAVDRFDRETNEFERRRRGNRELPFAQIEYGLPYLVASTDALLAQIRRLSGFIVAGDKAGPLLIEIEEALEVGRQRLISIRDRRPTDTNYLLPFDQVQEDVTARLPTAFGFDASAFTRAISSFEAPAQPQPVPTE